MANLTEQQTFDPAVYELATTDPVQGGPGGVDNKPHQQLANRTAWLKQQLDALIAAGGSSAEIAAAIAAHESAVDPHAQYTQAADLLTRTDPTHGRATRFLATGTDINTIKESGFYSGANLIGDPTPNGGWIYLEVIRHGGSYVLQRVTELGSGNTGNRMWQRILSDGGWQPWQYIAMESQFGAVLGTSGYQKLPGGLIIQWMRITSSIAGFENFPWPVAFTNAFLSVSNSKWEVGTGDTMLTVDLNGSTTTYLRAAHQYTSINSYIAGHKSSIIAIGY